jgi:beta-hydroxylase
MATQTKATQSFATEGVNGMQRPELGARIFMACLRWAERLNLKFSKLGNPCVYDNAVFPWAIEIEREWRAIRAELDAVMTRRDELPGFHELVSDVASISQDRGWKTFLLTGYGVRSERNIAQCPQTWRIVEKIPGLLTAVFSILEPGKHLPPHRGPYNGVLRLHLGLIVPEPREQLAIRVDRQICHWDEGKVLIFDDAYDHESWNRTDQTRVVLFVDFVKPLRFPANLVNWLILRIALLTPFVTEVMERERDWEKRFYR